MFKFVLVSIIFAISVSSCKKTEDVIIGDNTAPPDPTISNIVKKTYVNRLYIDILGREPDAQEEISALAILDKNNLSMNNRTELIDDVFSQTDYYNQVYNNLHADVLNGTDTSEILNTIDLFEYFLTQPDYEEYYDFFIYEIARLYEFKDVVIDFKAGTIGIVDVHKRFIGNWIYDEINMGSTNFVISMFQNFLFRYPTTYELDQSVIMVDGSTEVIFFEEGKSKEDFIDIFFGSTDYYEGQVRDVYLRYLFREPDTEEMTSKAITYKNSGDYKALQKDIVSSDEYVGL